MLLLVGIIAGTGQLAAQSNDFGVWTSVAGEIDIIKGLNFGVEGEFRSRDNSSEVDRWSGSADLSYRICPYLKAGVSYSFLYVNNEKKKGNVWENRHRYNIYLTGSYKWDRFTFSLRERFQHTYRVGVKEKADRANPKQILRSRLQISYNIRKCKFNPYVSCEFFNGLNDPQKNELEKVRYTIGTEYKLNKKNSFDFCYRYQTKDSGDDDEPNRHILGISYSHKF